MPSSLFGSPASPAPQQPQPSNGGLGNIMQLVRQFGEFKRMLSGKDPKQIVEGLLSSGQMSREQFDEFSQMAEGLKDILK